MTQFIYRFVSTVRLGDHGRSLFAETVEILEKSSDVLQDDLESVDEDLLESALLPSRIKRSLSFQFPSIDRWFKEVDDEHTRGVACRRNQKHSRDRLRRR